MRHEIRRTGETAIALTEFHDIVYREAATDNDAAAEPIAAPAQSKWEKQWAPDDVLLFRYSALTFNGHRIHYDRRYVTQVEGYPGLVVHGPMVATLLLDLLRDKLPDADIASYRSRAVRPIFDTSHFVVCGEPSIRWQDLPVMGERS